MKKVSFITIIPICLLIGIVAYTAAEIYRGKMQKAREALAKDAMHCVAAYLQTYHKLPEDLICPNSCYSWRYACYSFHDSVTREFYEAHPCESSTQAGYLNGYRTFYDIDRHLCVSYLNRERLVEKMRISGLGESFFNPPFSYPTLIAYETDPKWKWYRCDTQPSPTINTDENKTIHEVFASPDKDSYFIVMSDGEIKKVPHDITMKQAYNLPPKKEDP